MTYRNLEKMKDNHIPSSRPVRCGSGEIVRTFPKWGLELNGLTCGSGRGNLSEITIVQTFGFL